MEISVRFRVRVGWREITLHGDDKRHEGTQALQTTVRRCYHHYDWRDKGSSNPDSFILLKIFIKHVSCASVKEQNRQGPCFTLC